MKSININEKNITDQERVWNRITGLIKSYDPNVDPASCTFTKTAKGNWRVEKDGRKICLISKFVLPAEMVDFLGLDEG